MPTAPTFVIVGASLAGASAARELRKQGFRGRIVLIGSEEHPPYARPPLSKGLLTGKEGLDAIWVRPDTWYVDEKVELRRGEAVTRVARQEHMVDTDAGHRLHYDKLLLATGSRPRPLTLPGFAHDGVMYLRTLDDSLALKRILASGDKRVVIVGSGWIGLEAASSARDLGNQVTVLDRNPIPLASILGERIGSRFAELHRSHGVDVRSSVTVNELIVRGGKIAGVRFNGSDFVEADIVLVGVGAEPNTDLALEAGLEVDNGVLVDQFLTTSDPDIFAAGDIAHAWHPVILDRIRSEHWMNAMHSGRASARSMMGVGIPYDDVPYFYTDQFELSMEYSGYGALAAGADLVIRGDLKKLEFVAFWLRDRIVVAGMNVNVWEVNPTIQELIRSGRQIDPDRLRRLDVPIADV